MRTFISPARLPLTDAFFAAFFIADALHYSISHTGMFPGFAHPFTCLISGPSQCGKTFFLKVILRRPELYIHPAPQRVIWCYGIHNEAQMSEIAKTCPIPVDFTPELPRLSDLTPDIRTLIVIDDQMHTAGRSSEVADFFTKGSHHLNASVFLVLQNFFHHGKRMRDIQTNSNYLLLFNNPRDYSQINYMGRQMIFSQWPGYLREAYKQACSTPYSALLLDLTQDAHPERRIMSGLLPTQQFFYHVPVPK